MRARTFAVVILLVAVFSTLTQAQVVVTDDANTSSLYPTKNFGSSIALLVGSGSNSYVKFSLANLGSSVTSSNVSKATLVLYTDFVLASGTMDVYQVSGSWSEGSITYSNAPALGTKLFSAVSVTKAGFLSLDLTSTVQSWLNGALTNNGIALVPTSGSPISVSFDSKENILTSHVAQLPLVLVSAGPQGQQGLQGPQGTVGPQGPAGATGPAGPMGPAGGTGPTGPAGQQGMQGMMGLTGLTGAPGPIGPAGANGTGFNFRNGFDNSASYVANDVVTYNGSSYVATGASAGPSNPTPDTNTTAWSIIAAQGAAGTTGAAGAQGQPGPQGTSGSTGALGAAGPVGPMGPAGPPGTGGGGLHGMQEFTTSGTFTVPAGVTNIMVQMWGSIPLPAVSIGSGSGGCGSGAYSAGVFGVTPGTRYTVTVGTSTGSGTSQVVAPDGTALVYANGGQPGTADTYDSNSDQCNTFGPNTFGDNPVTLPGGPGGAADPNAPIARAGSPGTAGSSCNIISIPACCTIFGCTCTEAIPEPGKPGQSGAAVGGLINPPSGTGAQQGYVLLIW